VTEFTRDELKHAARDLIYRQLEDHEFLSIAEHEIYGELPDAQQEQIFQLINDATVVIGWIDK